MKPLFYTILALASVVGIATSFAWLGGFLAFGKFILVTAICLVIAWVASTQID